MESTNSYKVEDEVEETEKMLEQKKKEWELNHLQSLKEAEERKHAEEEDDMLFTYIRDDTYDQVNKKSQTSSRASKNQQNKATASNSSLSSSKATSGSAKVSDSRISSRSNSVSTSDDTHSPNKKNYQINFKPFRLKLGDDKIAQIKKTAHETIQAKNDLTSKLPTVRSPRKKLSIGTNKKINTTSLDKTGSTTTNILMSTKKIPQKITTAVTIVAKSSLRQQQQNNTRKQQQDNTTLKTPTSDKTKQNTPTTTTNNNKSAVTLKDFISTSKKPKIRSVVNSDVANGLSSPKTPSHKSALKNSTQKSATLKNAPLSTTPTAASRPSSLGSPDSLSGDIRRSSRTPRPKVMDDEWVVFN